jgi:hypothetical protein
VPIGDRGAACHISGPTGRRTKSASTGPRRSPHQLQRRQTDGQVNVQLVRDDLATQARTGLGFNIN